MANLKCKCDTQQEVRIISWERILTFLMKSSKKENSEPNKAHLYYMYVHVLEIVNRKARSELMLYVCSEIE